MILITTPLYTHTEVVVTFWGVTFFTKMVITRNHDAIFGRNLVEILPLDLLELSQPSRKPGSHWKINMLGTIKMREIRKISSMASAREKLFRDM